LALFHFATWCPGSDTGLGRTPADLSQVEVVFDSGEPRIHDFFDPPQFFRKQAILGVETGIHVHTQIGDSVIRISDSVVCVPDSAVRNQDAEQRCQARNSNRQHEADQLGVRGH
jgi:hypothetical protein